ncbi:MAG: FapA family protein [Pseudomonadota bacterium]
MLEKIALQKKLISKQDCLKAMEACKTADNYETSLKEYFILNNLIPEKTITQLINTTDAIKIMQTTMRFGTVAVSMGLISQSVLESALNIQRRSIAINERPKLIGQILLESGKLSKEQISQVVQEQKKLSQTGVHPSQTQTPDGEEPQQSEQKKAVESKTDPAPAPKPKPVKPVPEPESVYDNPGEPEIIEGGMILDIEDGGMSAYLRKTDTFDDNLIVEDIYSILLAKNIQYGLANDSAVLGFINSNGFRKNRFKIASGSPRIIGRDARIEYYFDTDHLKAGNMDEEGHIDFKNRGEIPIVEANTLLAEKFPLQESKTGRDIFGNELLANPAKDIELKTKAGVVISQDGRYAYSEIAGHPKLSWSGNINVVDLYLVKGNVGYETGHVAYKGNIEVQGCLKSGFQIKGYDIKIKEIDGGEVYAQGDLTIADGVNGAKIFSRGHVSANFVHDSEISCLGNLYIEKEIVDSKIETSGSCQVNMGKIINAQITSNQGILAKDIGTDKTHPNTIVVGQDLFVKNELLRIERQIIESEKQKIKLENKKNTLVIENQGYQQATARIANELDKASGDKKTLEDESKVLETQPDAKKDLQNVKLLIKQKDILFLRLDTQLNELFDNIEKNDTKIEQINELLEDLEDQIEDLNQERENYIDWGEVNPGKPMITANGKVCAGTIIQGKHSQKEIKETVTNALIKESQFSGDMANINLYEIQIHDNLKTR